MNARPVLYGYEGSTYTRMARLALALKGVDYDFVEVAAWDGTRRIPEYQDRHPFAKVPVFSHRTFELYETSAITRYVDESFPGPALQPDGARERAQMNQIICVHDNYIQPCWIKILASEILFNPLYGQAADEGLVQRTWPEAQYVAGILEGLLADRTLETPDLADIQLAPTVRYFSELSQGAVIIADSSRLSAWWQWMQGQVPVQEIVRPTNWETLY
jgi:glutathione S-transferase